MLSKRLFGLGAVAFLSLAACGDPIVGHWDCDDDDKCGDAAFDVKDDLTGDGDGTFNDGVPLRMLALRDRDRALVKR